MVLPQRPTSQIFCRDFQNKVEAYCGHFVNYCVKPLRIPSLKSLSCGFSAQRRSGHYRWYELVRTDPDSFKINADHRKTSTWTDNPTSTCDEGSRFALTTSGGSRAGLVVFAWDQVQVGPGGGVWFISLHINSHQRGYGYPELFLVGIAGGRGSCSMVKCLLESNMRRTKY